MGDKFDDLLPWERELLGVSKCHNCDAELRWGEVDDADSVRNGEMHWLDLTPNRQEVCPAGDFVLHIAMSSNPAPLPNLGNREEVERWLTS